MSNKTLLPTIIVCVMATCLPLSPAVLAAKQNTSEEVRINTLIRDAKTKADHEKIAQILEQEAKDEEAKAHALEAQAEAYKEHKHGLYGKNIEDLQEHTDALARHYEDAAKRHKTLADIHRQIASEIKP